MKLEEVKFWLGKEVLLSARSGESHYLLTGCILRKNENGFFYQVELQDFKNKRSVLICRLEDVKINDS